MYKTVPVSDLLELSGKVALVTGAAGGIGEAAARRLHEAGASVVVTDINIEGAQAVAASLNEGRDSSAHAAKLDISKADEVTAVFDEAIAKFGTLDILVNNAGIFPMVQFADMTEDDFMKVINVNLRGVFLCTKVAAEHMKQQKSGNIINITSIDAIHPSMTGLAHYDASKHGVWGFTKNVALELAPHNIRVNAIAPGGVATPGTGAVKGEIPAAMEAFTKQIPLSRFAQADEIGKVVLFLASDMASYMHGEQVVVDGGRLLA